MTCFLTWHLFATGNACVLRLAAAHVAAKQLLSMACGMVSFKFFVITAREDPHGGIRGKGRNKPSAMNLPANQTHNRHAARTQNCPNRQQSLLPLVPTPRTPHSLIPITQIQRLILRIHRPILLADEVAGVPDDLQPPHVSADTNGFRGW
jgi:hypothetical protein